MRSNQLSYSSEKKWLRRMDSNHRPSGYEPDELPLLHAASPNVVYQLCWPLSNRGGLHN